ncbi:Hypothetical predicted protein [Prunus dulcis]|uniref:Uncharacterized protein n=1 Tax=Prunus dulcis TaxID=3755 RepID=A0A5E4F514_PRUDU|nr:Hypothetical predicted protein [Prunus dulcis]
MRASPAVLNRVMRASPAVLDELGLGGFGSKKGFQQQKSSPGDSWGPPNGQARRRKWPEVQTEVQDKIPDASMASALKIRIFFYRWRVHCTRQR